MAQAIPVFRIFDYSKAMEFYNSWLGFHVDWEAKPDDTPAYLQISLQGIVLHLSENHGDGSPGAHVHIDVFSGLREFHQQLLNKNYKYMRPGIGPAPWDEKTLCMEVIDPFGNRLTFTGE